MKDRNIIFDLDQHGHYAALKCPICGFDYVAPVCVTTLGGINHQDSIGTRIDASGVSIFERGNEGRGVKIEMKFTCECQHSFIYAFHFHKGQTHITLEEYPYSDQKVIWRN